MNYRMKSAGLIAAMAIVFGAAVFLANESGAQGKTYRIGDRGPAGGWIFYDKGNSDGGWRYLEAASEDQSAGAVWGCFKKKSIPGAHETGIGTGKRNTQAIEKGCGEADIAARICSAYRGGGKSDWYLPSRDELHLVYINLHRKGIGGFTGMYYWSSTEDDISFAVFHDFTDDHMDSLEKDYPQNVRAIRAF